MKFRLTPRTGSLLLLASFYGFPAVAGDWQLVADGEKMRVEIDVATLAPNGKTVKAWEREIHSKPQQALPGDFYFKSAKSLALHNCAERTTSYLYRGYYAEDGSEIKAIDSEADLGKVNFLVPDSLEERKLIFACTYKRAAKKPGKSVAAKKAAALPTPPQEQAPAKPAEKDGQKGTPPAKIAGKGGKAPVESKSGKTLETKPDSTTKMPPAASVKTPAMK